jgi:hypothetical protein
MTTVNLKTATNQELITDLKKITTEERRLTTLVLEYLREVETRKIHLEMGYGSLYEFCKTELHYSEGSAHRRISAMRLMAEIPEIKPLIESGAVSLSGAASVQGFCTNQKKNEKPVALAEKRKLVEDIQHKTTRQVESMLLALDPESIKKDRERLVTPELTEIKITVDQTTMKQIADLKSWLSHSMPFASTKDILVMALQELAKRRNPMKTNQLKYPVESAPVKKPNEPILSQDKSTRNLNPERHIQKNHSGTKSINPASRYIPSAIKRLVWHKHQGKCCFKNPTSGRICGSQKFVQIDHIFPFSRGGEHAISNLQLLCGAHNRNKGSSIAHNVQKQGLGM